MLYLGEYRDRRLWQQQNPSDHGSDEIISSRLSISLGKKNMPGQWKLCAIADSGCILLILRSRGDRSIPK